ncbi:site-specific integrase [Flavitalea flava]
MIEQSFGLLFFLKKPKGIVTAEFHIYLRITVDGAAVELSTKRKCDPLRWNQHAERATGSKETFKNLNAYLETLQEKVYEIKRRLIDQNKMITAETIRNILTGQGDTNDRPRMLMEIFQHHNDQIAALVGKGYAPGTLERYITSFKHTRSFLEWKYKISDIDIRKLDYEFITEYEFWIKSVRNCDHNTTMKYLANFRKIVKRCLQNGWLLRDPFSGFSMAKKEVERHALSKEELQDLGNKKYPIERLNHVRDIFLFSCYTGLAYADVKKLKRSEISTGIDGGKWIFSNRQKTNTLSRIPLLPKALEILALYAEHPQCLLTDKVLPVLSNQKMNAYLKEIADLCGIRKNLTYHIARHTFATTITLSNGVPMETVSKMLGHKNLRTTQHYAKILDHKISADMMGLMEKFK